MNKKKTRDEKRFSEAPLVRQANGELKRLRKIECLHQKGDTYFNIAPKIQWN